MADAKLPDAQAGYEKGISGVLLAQAGCNRIQACAGMLNSTKCCAHEALIIDNDMLGSVMRTVRGLEINEATLSVEVIRQSALNEGHYLGHKQTLSLMESHFLYPEVADRSPMDLWEDAGSPTIFDKAREKARTILDNHYPNYLGAALDEKIRAKWKIHLPPARMKRALDA